MDWVIRNAFIKVKSSQNTQVINILKSKEFGLGTAGLKRAPLNIIINSKIPRNAPCGVDPGRCFLEDVAPMYLMNMDLLVR